MTDLGPVPPYNRDLPLSDDVRALHAAILPVVAAHVTDGMTALDLKEYFLRAAYSMHLNAAFGLKGEVLRDVLKDG